MVIHMDRVDSVSDVSRTFMNGSPMGLLHAG